MFRTLLLFSIGVAFLGGNAVIDQRKDLLTPKRDGFTVQSGGQPVTVNRFSTMLVAPDLKIHIDNFSSPALGNNCLGYPTKTGYITVTNVGDDTCRRPRKPTAIGYSAVSNGYGVIFQVTSVGPMPTKLAPGATLNFIVQNNTCNAQKAIEQGYFEINQPACHGETNKTNNKATRVQGTTYNPN